jgi:hypothetical protein
MPDMTIDTSGSSLYLYPEGSLPLSMAAVQKLEQPTEQQSSLLLVTIVSSVQDATFTLPVSLVKQRELEMQAASRKFGIPPERWSGSLIYKAFQEQGRMEVVLMPEKECADQNYSNSFQWEPWLTNLVQSYYQTGQLVVPDACQGLDLLLLLEYFGIIYQPNQLTFDSPAAYQRVKVWSDYLTVRSGIADWVAVAISSVQQTHYFFATTPILDQWAELGQERLTHLDGGLSVPADKTSCGVVFELFNRAEPEGTAALMRQDFSVYLQNILTNVNVSFPVNPLTVHFDELSMEQKKRAVLMVNVIDANEPTTAEKTFRTRSELSSPVDELVQEDLDTGRLESLMQQIDARNPTYKGRSSAYTAQFLTMFESTTAPVVPSRSKQPEKPPRPKPPETPPKAPRAQPKPVATSQPQTQLPETPPKATRAQPKPVATSQRQTQPPVQTQPKSPAKSVKRQESPRKVTAIDHLYQDLDDDQESPSDDERAIETSYHTVPENKGKKVHSIMPVEIYGNSNIESITTPTPVQPETTILMTEPVYNMVPPVGTIPETEPLVDNVSEKSKYVAPVTSVVHSERNEVYSVTSALTNPNFDDDASFREIFEGEGEIKAQALRQEWIQESVMNHDVFERAQKLLKEESQRFDREQNTEDRQQKNPNDPFDIWDYMMDACQVLAPVKRDLCMFTSPESRKNSLSPARSIRTAAPQSVVENLLGDVVCSSPFVPCESNFQSDEKNIAKPVPVVPDVPQERSNMSAANYSGLVKSRMEQFKEHCDEQTRQDSLSLKPARSFVSSNPRQECGEVQGIEVCHNDKSQEKAPPQPTTPPRLQIFKAIHSPARSTSHPITPSPQKPSPPGTPPKEIPQKKGVSKKTASSSIKSSSTKSSSTKSNSPTQSTDNSSNKRGLKGLFRRR